METQIAGRLIRFGRKTSATFHYIMLCLIMNLLKK